jgi:uncharacterized phage protein (predicted DNA packaging)
VSAVVVTLADTKAWLRVDSDAEDALIEGLIETAEELVEGILRFSLSEFEEVPEPVKHAIYYAVSKLFEERNELNTKELTEVLKALLFTYRKVEW